MWWQILHDTASFIKERWFCLPARRQHNDLELCLLPSEKQVGHKPLILLSHQHFATQFALPEGKCKQILCLSNRCGTKLGLSDQPGSNPGKN